MAYCVLGPRGIPPPVVGGQTIVNTQQKPSALYVGEDILATRTKGLCATLARTIMPRKMSVGRLATCTSLMPFHFAVTHLLTTD